MKLTVTEIKNAKPKEKPYKMSDGGGLYLLVKQSGKYWRYDYRFADKRKTLAIGVFDEVGLKDARERLRDAKQKLESGVDPSIHKQMQKHTTKSQYENTFESIANEWYLSMKDHWSESHGERVISYLKRDVYPWLGSMPIESIKAPEIITIIKRVSGRGALDAAKRVKGFVQQVFDYAVAHAKVSRNPAKDINLSIILPPREKKHFATLTNPEKIGELMRAIDNFQGTLVVKSALKLSTMVMLRPSEVSNAEWSEIDFDNEMWTIEVRRMKARQHVKKSNDPEKAHYVPLSRQALAIFKDLHPLTGNGKYIFPSARGMSRAMSNNAVRAALRTMGYNNSEITPHGFRAMASTMLNELGWNADAIERQLSHRDKNVIRRTYNHAGYLKERKEMMQFWADYLDDLKEGADILPFKRQG